MLEAGIKGYQEMIVSKRDTAKVHGSGTLDVLATPRMIALVEETAWKSIAEHLEPGMGSVGIRVDIRHLAATPVGMKVWCETVVSEVEGRKLSFHATVYDEAGKIGEGARGQNRAAKKWWQASGSSASRIGGIQEGFCIGAQCFYLAFA